MEQITLISSSKPIASFLKSQLEKKEKYKTDIMIWYILIELLKLKTVAEQVLAVGLTTAVLTFGFCLYFTSYPETPNFFSKWFHTVGYSSIIYDVILLVVIFLIYKYLQQNTN